MLKKIITIVSFLIVLGGAVGGLMAWSDTFAKQCDLEVLSSRLEQKILDDRLHNLQQRMWSLEDRYGGPEVPLAPNEIKIEYRQLKLELEAVKRKLHVE